MVLVLLCFSAFPFEEWNTDDCCSPDNTTSLTELLPSTQCLKVQFDFFISLFLLFTGQFKNTPNESGYLFNLVTIIQIRVPPSG